MEWQGRFDDKLCAATAPAFRVRQTDSDPKAAGEISASGIPTELVQAGLKEVRQCLFVVDQVDIDSEHADLLPSIACTTERGTVEDITGTWLDRNIDLSTSAPFLRIQRVIPPMKKADGEAIVNVVFVAAHSVAPRLAANWTSKAGVQGLAKNFADAVAENRTRVTGINMGWKAAPSEYPTQSFCHSYRSDEPANWKEEAGKTISFSRTFQSAEVARSVAVQTTGERADTIAAMITDFRKLVV